MDECGEHEDLLGLGHRSVIPYIHRRTELYYSNLYEPEPFLFFYPFEEAPARAFYSSRSGVTLRPGARQVALKWLKPYTTSRVLMAMSSK
jgi:hypothetical protein